MAKTSDIAISSLRSQTILTITQANGNNEPDDSKRPRRSQRLSSQSKPLSTPVNNDYLPTPLTVNESTATPTSKDATITPGQTPAAENVSIPSSQPGDTQPFSQFVYPPRAFADEVEDEAAEGVWGYLLPLNEKSGKALVLRKRDNCCAADGSTRKNTKQGKNKPTLPPGGYLIGRHRECGMTRDRSAP